MDMLELIERTELHDASIIDMAREGDRVRLEFENVWLDDETCYTVTINLGGVRKMTCDNELVDTLHMETEDGGVIAFRRSGNIAELVVTWTLLYPSRRQDPLLRVRLHHL